MSTKVKSWIAAMRLRTLPLTIACIALGALLAASRSFFSWSIFLLSLSTALFLQILSNLANDYGDTVHGADHEDREGPLREVQSGKISLSQMRVAMAIFVALSLISGIVLLQSARLSSQTYLVFLGLGLIAIFAAVLYTNGKLPYGYIGLGDLSVFMFFGLLGVAGSYFLYHGPWSWDILLPASSCGLLSVAVLNINNIRDIESDKKAGKFSIPVRIGRSKAVLYHYSLLLLALILAVVFVIMNYQSPLQFLFLLTAPLLFINARAVRLQSLALKLDPYLKQMAITTLLFCLLFGISMLF